MKSVPVKFQYWLGSRAWGKSVLAGLGGAVCIGILATLTMVGHAPLLIAPFGASCVLVFGVAASPFAQPRNILGGYLLSALMGLLALYLLGAGIAATAVGVGLAIAVMLITETTHPPAGAVPIVVALTQPDWSFLFMPVLVGVLLIVIIGRVWQILGKHLPTAS